MSRFFLITLGCFRNEVESDNFRSVLGKMKYTEVDSPLEADFIIVNSCGFISEACDEGIDTILKISEISSSEGKSTPIIVAGCMSQRYGIELMNEMPEISAVIGVDWGGCIEQAISEVTKGKRYLVDPGAPRFTNANRCVDSSDTASLFIRISDGCDRRCSFCTIPSIRGRYVSRRKEDIIAEIDRLAGDREREVVLVGQDLTYYGRDLNENINLAGLIRKVSGIKNVRWIRLLYLQPEGLSEELVEEILSNQCVCNYFDIPFQHASRTIIERMGRSGDGSTYRECIRHIREKAPGSSIRTTVMVGFPGEGEKEFNELVTFIADVGFDWLGVFRFSPEEGTRASALEGMVPHELSLERYNRILEIQETVEEQKSANLIGKEMEIVIEDRCEEGEYCFIGRSYREAPVVDGVIYLGGKRLNSIEKGDFVTARITGREGLDLAGEIIRADA